MCVCVTFLRDKESDIRIKLTSISRQHARIFVDENGQCNLEHLSKTNPTILNGSAVKDVIVLQDGDKISFGDRQFVFRKPGLLLLFILTLGHVR